MQSVSTAYKQQMKQGVRNPSFVELKYSILSVEAHEDAAVSDNGGIVFSSNDIADGNAGQKKGYITFEPNRWQLNRGLMVVPVLGEEVAPEVWINEYVNTGFVSAEMSTANGTFTTFPVVSVKFSTPQSFYGLTLRFDTLMEEYPSEIMVNGNWYYPNSAEYTIPDDFYEIESLTITFVNMGVPNRRARLSDILFGQVVTFRNNQLVKVGYHADVDFLSTDLSQKTLSFTIDNSGEQYNPLNPQGLIQYVEEKQPVSVRFGYELNNGSVEWIPEESFILKGSPTVKGMEATFTAEDKLNSLTGTFFWGLYDPTPISLYDLALEVLYDAGVDLFELDSKLYYIYTKAALPVATHAECLQIIANAAQCILYTDRGGVIRIQDALDPVITLSDAGHMGFSNADAALNSVNFPTEQYVDFLPGTWQIGRKDLRIAPDSGELLNAGFVASQYSGTELSNSSIPGYVIGPEPAVLNIHFSIPVTSDYELPIWFDVINEEYPAMWGCDFLLNGVVVDSFFGGNSSVSQTIYARTTFDTIRVILSEWSAPNRHPVISKIGKGRANDFVIGLGDIMQQPTVQKQALAKSVSVNCYNYALGNSQELYRETVGVNGQETTLRINHSAAGNITATFSGGTIINEHHCTYHSEIIVSGTGELVLTGQELVTTTTALTRQLNARGEDKPVLENPLITDMDNAANALTWIADYFQKRTHLSVSYRGNPELDVYDTIYMENQFRPNFPVRIMSLDLDFNGGLNGKAKAVMI